MAARRVDKQGRVERAQAARQAMETKSQAGAELDGDGGGNDDGSKVQRLGLVEQMPIGTKLESGADGYKTLTAGGSDCREWFAGGDHRDV